MSKKDFTKAVADLTDPKTLDAVKEKVKTIVIDTVEDVVELFKAAVCAKYGVEDVGQVQQAEKGNPNGYNLYRTQFKKQINLLTSSGYTVIFISHEETIQVSMGEFDDKGNELTRPFIIPKGSAGEKDSCRFIKDLCDFRFYISSNGIDKETKKTVMSEAWCVQTDKFYAGSRFNTVPVINPFTAENVIKEIEEAQKRSGRILCL